MRIVTRVLIAALLAFVIGCEDTATPPPPAEAPIVQLPATEGSKPWTHENFKNDPRNFQFAIVSDRTGGHRPGVFAQAVRKLNLLQPEFVISVGDLIEGYTESNKILDSQWEEFNSMVEKFEMPFFYVAGNHDINNPVMAKKWEKHYGKPWYHFVYNDTLFLVVCSEDGHHINIGDEQLAYIDKTLKDNLNVRWTFVFVHVPMWDLLPVEKITPEKSHWTDVEEMLKGRNYTVFAGHRHIYKKIKRNGMDYFTLATTGGMSDLVRPTKMDHFVWVTMTDQGPRIANLLLDGVLGKNIITKETEKQIKAQPLVDTGTVLISEQIFRGGKGKVVIHNVAIAPMKVSGNFKESGTLKVSPAHFEMTIPPRSSKAIELNIVPSEPIDVDKLSPISMDWKLNLAMPDGGIIESSGTGRISIEKGTLIKDAFRDDFSTYNQDSEGKPVWRSIKGKWEVQNGEYHQLLRRGYDYSTAADAWVTGDYTIQAKLRVVEGSMESGLMFNLSTRSANVACQMIRFSGPKNIWHGYFGKTGIFTLEGSAPTGIKGDGSEWITLAVAVHNSRGTYDILINDKPVAQGFKLQYTAQAGRPRCGVALIGCNGHVAYDDVTLTPIK